MADGNDWELVSLTASTYAAAPGPILPPPDADKKNVEYVDLKPDSPAAMFVSGHFSFPTKEDVHLLKEPDCKAGSDKVCDKEFCSAMMVGYTDLDSSCAKGKLDHDLPGFSFLDMHNSVSLGDVVFGDGMGLDGLSLVEEKQPMSPTSSLDSPDTVSDISRKSHNTADPATDPSVLSHPAATAPIGSAAVPEDVHNAKDQSENPSEAWWKKTFSFLCNNAKESVTFQLFFVAATILGLAILGQRCLQREKLPCEKFRLQFNTDSEKIGCAVGPLGQVKGAMIGGSQQQSDVALRPSHGAFGI
ncbi:hypothetical protein ACP70R_044728 [Stipagrostis hirtigluma subsp. patula]